MSSLSIQWTNKANYTYIIVDRNPLVSNYYYGPKTDTTTISCTKYWHPQKRGTRTDSQTPSLDDGGLVHFSGPRLIRYDQLPLSPIVVTPTKVFLRNRHPLSSSSIYSNTEQDTEQKSQSNRWHLSWTLNFIWQGVYIGSSVINSSTHDIGLKMPLLQFVIDDCCEFFWLLRLTIRSNVKPKCGNNSSESLHVFLLFWVFG